MLLLGNLLLYPTLTIFIASGMCCVEKSVLASNVTSGLALLFGHQIHLKNINDYNYPLVLGILTQQG